MNLDASSLITVLAAMSLGSVACSGGTSAAADEAETATVSGRMTASSLTSDATTTASATAMGHETSDTGSVTSGPAPDVGSACVGCAMCDSPDRPTDFEQMLLDMAPQTWFQAPDSHMRDVCPAGGSWGNCQNVIAAWSTGAYDGTHRRMFIWGGGHGDYSGNELYAFDLRTGTWSTLTEPSDGSFGNQDPLPDGQPVSRHSYDGIEYLPDLDVLWAHGGSRAHDGNSTNVTWTWSDGAGWVLQTTAELNLMLASAYDPASRQIMVMQSEELTFYNVDTQTWSAASGFGVPPLWPRYAFARDKTGVMDPTRGLFWAVGAGNVMVWDVAAEQAVTDDWVTEGGGEFSNAEIIGDHSEQLFTSGGGDVFNSIAPGIEYDPTMDAFVAWTNGGAPYILDLQTRQWSTGGGEGAPVSANSGGTYGRWRYLAAYNVYILVNSVDDNVHFYKHTPGCGA